MNILSWNCQGAASLDFIRVLKELVKLRKIECLGLLETKVSGYQADKICTSIEFHNWVRVVDLVVVSGSSRKTT